MYKLEDVCVKVEQFSSVNPTQDASVRPMMRWQVFFFSGASIYSDEKPLTERPCRGAAGRERVRRLVAHAPHLDGLVEAAAEHDPP
jgi:hypothetical protein